MKTKYELALIFFILINSILLIVNIVYGFPPELVIRQIAGNLIPIGILLLPYD